MTSSTEAKKIPELLQEVQEANVIRATEGEGDDGECSIVALVERMPADFQTQKLVDKVTQISK